MDKVEKFRFNAYVALILVGILELGACPCSTRVHKVEFSSKTVP